MHRILNPKTMAFPYTVPVGWIAVVDVSSLEGRMAIMGRQTHLAKGYLLVGESGDWAVCPDFMFHRRDDMDRSINRVRKTYQEAA
jgi:hypothetical protein